MNYFIIIRIMVQQIFIHYAYDLCTCPREKEAELLDLGKGHYSDEIEVPILDDEAWWLEEKLDE